MEHRFITTVLYLLCFLIAFLLPNGMYGTTRNLNTSSGLSNGYVMSIAQDADGHIWVATEDGLNMFDGLRFINYNKGNSGLIANELNCVAFNPAQPDILYIATQRDGVCIFDRKSGKISKFDVSLASTGVTSVIPASDGGVWFTHYHYGVEHLNPATGKRRCYNFSSVPGMPRRAWTMAEGNNGKIYVGHAHEGFSVVDTVAKTCINHRAEPGKPSLPGDDVTSVCVDSAGYVWIGTDKGAAMYNPSTGRITPFVHGGPGSIGAGRIKSIRQMADGNIWFATSQGGISILNPKVYTFSDINYVKFSSIPIEGEPEGTSGAAITCIFPDSFGNVWIGNYRNGIDVISHIPPVLSRMDYRVNINETFVYKPAWACFQGNDGTLWVGGENEIVWFNDTDSGIVSLPFNDYKAPINTICQDSDGMLWIGSNEAGAMIYNPGKATFQRVTGVPDNIRGLFPNAPGDMWICTNYGIYSSDGKSSHRLDGINALLRDNVVQCVAKDLEGV